MPDHALAEYQDAESVRRPVSQEITMGDYEEIPTNAKGKMRR
jgi:hypothetical protein